MSYLELIVQHNEFRENESLNGATIYIDDSNAISTSDLSNNIYHYNVNSGATFYASHYSGTLSLMYEEFSYNTATNGGAAIRA